MEVRLDVKPFAYKCPFTGKWVVLVPHRIVQIDSGTTMIVWRCNMANCIIRECRYSVPNVKGSREE